MNVSLYRAVLRGCLGERRFWRDFHASAAPSSAA